MIELPKDVQDGLDEVYGRVVAKFKIEQTPQGGAPERIRSEWVGITLPVREAAMAQLAFGAMEIFDFVTFKKVKAQEPVGVTGIEAVHELEEAGKLEAARFWTPHQHLELVFRASEGNLLPIEE